MATAFGAGVLGAFVMSILMSLGIWMQWSPLSLEMLLGSFITRQTGGWSWALGFGWHLLNGGIFALVYAVLFRAMGQAGAGVGAMMAIGHWVLAGLLLNIVYAIHPLMLEGFPVTGFFFWSAFGGMTVFGSLFLHLIYGAIVGAGFASSIRQELVRRELHRHDETGGLRRSA